MVHVDHQHRQRVVAARRTLPFGRQRLRQRAPVRHPRHGVLAHQCFERRAVAAELGLGELALGDVLDRAGHARIHAGRVVFAPHVQPALVPAVDDAVLHAQRLACAQGIVQGRQHLGAVFRVHLGKPLHTRHGGLGRQAEQLARHGREGESIARTFVHVVADRHGHDLNGQHREQAHGQKTPVVRHAQCEVSIRVVFHCGRKGAVSGGNK